MTTKLETRTLRSKPQCADKAERPAEPEKPALLQRKAPRPAPKRTPRLPAYVRHA